MMNQREEKIKQDLIQLKAKVDELLIKTYGSRFTTSEGWNKETNRIIDNLIIIKITTWNGGSYYTQGCEIILEEKEYSYSSPEDSVRRRHIKKYDEEKLIRTINSILKAAKLAKERREAKKLAAQVIENTKEHNKQLQKDELPSKYFTNTYEGQIKGGNVSLNSHIMRCSDGNYTFKGQIHKVSLDKMIQILEIIGTE